MDITIIDESKFEKVLEHLRYSFSDEPLNVAIGLFKKGQECSLLEKHDLDTLKDGMSVMALDRKTGEIAGVALNGIAKRGDPEEGLDNMKKIDNTAYHRVFGLLFSVNKEVDLFTMYGVEKIFELRILAVSQNFRGHGLANQLFRKSEMVAKDNGFKIIKVDATSLYTQKIAEKIGMKTIKSVRYKDFRDECGKIIYNLDAPHECYKVMVKELLSSQNE